MDILFKKMDYFLVQKANANKCKNYIMLFYFIRILR